MFSKPTWCSYLLAGKLLLMSLVVYEQPVVLPQLVQT
jgi:hypothetical protein